ncbi:FtsX-like permease family protein [Candidatus Nitrospira bockiana]
MRPVYFELIRRHASARPGRTALTVVGIALGVAVAVAVRTANVEVLRVFEQSVETVAGRATLQIAGGELGLDEALIRIVRQHPDVMTATPVLQVSGSVLSESVRPSHRVLTILALDLLDASDVKRLRFAGDGDRPLGLNTLLDPTAVFIGARLAADWGLHSGAEVDIVAGARRYRLTIAGIVGADTGRSSAWERLAVMDIAAAQWLFDLVGRVDRIDVVTRAGRSVESVRADLQARLPSGVVVMRPSTRTEQVERMVQAFQLNLTVLSSVSLLVGLFLVYNTVAFAVVQRRREIGMLSAMGFSRRRVGLLFVGEAAVLGLAGGLTGSVAGLVLARSLVSRLGRTISDLYVSVDAVQADRSLLGFVLDAPGWVWWEGALLGVFVSVLGGLMPSLDAARTAPARALVPGDYEVVQRWRARPLAAVGLVLLFAAWACSLPGPIDGIPLFGYAAALALLLGLACLIPLCLHGFSRFLLAIGSGNGFGGARRAVFLARLAADQIGRAVGRNAVTISAMMVGMAIMVGVGTMVGSFRDTVQVWIDQTVMADLIVAPATWLHAHESGQLAKRLPAELAEVLASVPGVAAVDTYRDVSVQVGDRPVSLVSRDLPLHAERSRYLFTNGRAEDILQRTVAQDGVIISEVLGQRLGLHAGGSVTLATPAGDRGFPIFGIFYDYATDGGKIVMDRSLYQRVWMDRAFTVAPVYLEPSADLASVRRRIEEHIVGWSGEDERGLQLVVLSNRELRHEIMSIFDRTFAVTYALELIAIVIALLGIANTLVMSVLQRRREFALLRAMGTTSAYIRQVMLWESGYLGLLGALLGLVGGLALAFLLITVINKQSFGWTIQFSMQFSILAQAVMLGLAAAIVAGYIPARWASRQSIAEGLRYE